MVAWFAKIRALKLPRELKLPRGLKLPRWGRHALGVALTAALLMPGLMLVRPSDEPESPEAATRAREVAATDSISVFVRDGMLEGDLASLAPKPVDGGDPSEPTEASTDGDAPAATEPLAIETSTIAAGNPSPVRLRADGNGLLAEAAAEPQPAASIAPPDAADQPAPERRPLPLYLRADETAGTRPGFGKALEDRYDCIIEPFELVEVGSALTAVVESVSVERSDFVVAGQVLAQLEASPERATVAVASARARMDGELLARRARMDLGGRKRKRADQLFDSKALSADLRDEIRTEAEVARAVVQEARERKELMELQRREALERLREHTILSPVSGVVVDRLKSPGEVVKEETIVVLAQIDPLRVEVVLPAAVFGSVATGMWAEIIPELPNAGVQVASVTIVDRVVDATSGTFGVRLELPNADHAVPSGLRCQVRFLQVD